MLTGVEKIGDIVLIGGDLEGSFNCFSIIGSGKIGVLGDERVVASGVGSSAGRESVEVVDSLSRLEIVGGKGLGIGFSTGFVRPSFISWSDGIRSTSLPLLIYASEILYKIRGTF